MAATTATVHAIGVSGQGYHIDAAVPDAVNTLWTFDSGAGATTTSQAYMQFPENVVITDISMAGAPTATRGRITSSGVPTGTVIAYGAHLFSLNNRPNLNLKVKAGSMIGIVQL